MTLSLRAVLLFALVLPLALPVPSRAADATLVADLNPTRSSDFSFEGLQPRQLTAVGGRVVFSGLEPGVGNEIWTSDGTDLGTRLLRDTCPGVCHSEIRILGTAGGVAYFLAGEAFEARELWRTDGTPAGTFQLLSGVGVPHRENEPLHAALGNRFLFFSCGDSCTLWQSDGSRAGTVAMRDVGGRASEVALVGSILYFTLELGARLPEIWRSDGTAAGTTQIRSLPSDGRFLTAAGGRVSSSPGRTVRSCGPATAPKPAPGR